MSREESLKRVPERDQVAIYNSVANGTTINIAVKDRVTIITPASGAAVTAVLPNVYEAEGLEFLVRVPAVAGGCAVTLTARGSKLFGGDYTLDAAQDYIVLRASQGQWAVVENKIA